MFEIFERGGPIMWPLLITSLIALSLILERLAFFFSELRSERPEQVKKVLDSIREAQISRAIQLSTGSDDPVALTLHDALTSEEEVSLDQAYACSAQMQVRRFQKGLDSLDTIVTLAPLLGLLGTVTGMIRAFGLIGQSELGAPVAITGGIAEALIATAFGLGIAILSLVPLNLLQSFSDRIRFRLEDTGSRLELICRSAEKSAEKAAHLAEQKGRRLA